MNKYIVAWLASACVLIISMVIIGGITRLTQSGLSMVKWEPVTGIIPPLTEEKWEAEFQLYQNYPEFRKINPSMNLNEFKSIYFWEYLHRLIGRGIGIFFIIPFIIFYVKKRISPWLMKRLRIMFLIGIIQGFMGWFMVTSGLVDNQHVSHYRLAIHFLLAVGLVGYIYWVILDFTDTAGHNPDMILKKWVRLSVVFTGLIVLQMFWGAMMAGLKAGYAWNTFPAMNGQWLPEGLFEKSPWWINFFQTNMTVQFIHRSTGMLLAAAAIGLWLMSLRELHGIQKRDVFYIFTLTLIQVIAGIFTLILFIPVWLAVLHQLLAVILFLTSLRMIRNFHIMSGSRVSKPH